MINRILKTLNLVFALIGFPNFVNALMMFATGDVITGAAGTFKQGDATLGSATEMKVLNVNVRSRISGVIDTTDSGNADGWKSKVPGKFKEWSGDCEAQIREGDTELVPGTEYDVHFVAKDTTGDEVHWSGKAILMELGVAIPVVADDVVKRSLTFEGNGALTKTDATGA